MLSPPHKSRRPSMTPRESPRAQLQKGLPSIYKYKKLHHTHTAMHGNGTAKQADDCISTPGISQAVRGNSDLPARAWGAASTTGRPVPPLWLTVAPLVTVIGTGPPGQAAQTAPIARWTHTAWTPPATFTRTFEADVPGPRGVERSRMWQVTARMVANLPRHPRRRLPRRPRGAPCHLRRRLRRRLPRRRFHAMLDLPLLASRLVLPSQRGIHQCLAQVRLGLGGLPRLSKSHPAGRVHLFDTNKRRVRPARHVAAERRMPLSRRDTRGVCGTVALQVRAESLCTCTRTPRRAQRTPTGVAASGPVVPALLRPLPSAVVRRA